MTDLITYQLRTRWPKTWKKASTAQIEQAERFERLLGINLHETLKWLDWCFDLEAGILTPEQFQQETGHAVANPAFLEIAQDNRKRKLLHLMIKLQDMAYSWEDIEIAWSEAKETIQRREFYKTQALNDSNSAV